jgi:hypothetical protein
MGQGSPASSKDLHVAQFPGESNQRTVNNVLRHEYRVLSDREKELMRQIKDKGQEFLDLLDVVEAERLGGRGLSIARTKTEEAVMWSVKHLTG